MDSERLTSPDVQLEMSHITKRFPGVVANHEIHALPGENSAGKTTQIRILYGLDQPDEGNIVVRGQPVYLRSPSQATDLGIDLMPQHFMLARHHTVAKNIARGLPGRSFLFPPSVRDNGYARWRHAMDLRSIRTRRSDNSHRLISNGWPFSKH